MKYTIASSLIALSQLVAAAPDPLITAPAELRPRQDPDPSLLGWISESGASEFSDQRSCDFPQTLSRSGSLAQCCGTTGPCEFYSSCSAGTLFAASASVFCDQGLCNTAVIVETAGARSGQSYLGCWATSLGSDPFTIVQDIGSAPVATPTPTGASSSEDSSNSSSDSASATDSSESSGTGSATGSSPSAAQSTGAAAVSAMGPSSGIFGLITMLFVML